MGYNRMFFHENHKHIYVFFFFPLEMHRYSHSWNQKDGKGDFSWTLFVPASYIFTSMKYRYYDTVASFSSTIVNIL